MDDQPTESTPPADDGVRTETTVVSEETRTEVPPITDDREEKKLPDAADAVETTTKVEETTVSEPATEE